MASFYDHFGTLWVVRLTLGDVFEFQSESGMTLLEGETLPENLPEKLLPFLLREGVAKRYRTSREIEEAFPEEVRRRAVRALYEELHAFYPRRDPNKDPIPPRSRALAIEEQLWKIGGMLGIDIRPFRLSELLLMARGAQEERWDRLSTLMALMVNLHRSKSSPAAHPRDYHPLKKAEKIPTLNRHELTALFRNLKKGERNHGE